MNTEERRKKRKKKKKERVRLELPSNYSWLQSKSKDNAPDFIVSGRPTDNSAHPTTLKLVTMRSINIIYV
jgi:hypothetical protein